MNFKNIPALDFTIEENRINYNQALEKNISLKNKFNVFPIINNNKIKTNNSVISRCPADLTELGTVDYADLNLIPTIFETFKKSTWKNLSFSARAEIIKKAATIMQERHLELATFEILEVGKTWVDAEQDVAEGIDALNFYANEAIKFDNYQVNQEVLGELNLTKYLPVGNVLVISPWNFPIGIAAAITAAGLVMGNNVILKPAEQSSISASKFIEIFLEAGVHPEALTFLPGNGEIVGAELVKHQEIDLICFTGSVDVGLNIINNANIDAKKNKKIKKYITEMGGKNALIIDSGADLDDAIPAILSSAFGFAGQKCSALSRLIVIEEVYEFLLSRLKSAIDDLCIENPINSEAFVSPVIDKSSFDRINDIKIRNQNCLIKESTIPKHLNGYFISPSLYEISDYSHELWTTELFAPILTITKAKDFKSAIEIANNSSFALTGGIFSRSPKNIEYAIKNLDCGNLYINRGITGAIIQRQPFGGHKLSGTGPKAGGINYLKSFVIEKSITENSIRKGFVPDLT